MKNTKEDYYPFILAFIVSILLVTVFSCKTTVKEVKMPTIYEVTYSSEEWRDVLTPDQHYIMRRSGTERAFSSPLNYEKRDGYYICPADSTILFIAPNKFDSGTGWPSFTGGNNLEYEWDGRATEVRCITCGSHLGHLFHDIGPGDDKARYCINGDALIFVPTE